MGTRYYNPTTTRLLSPDPYGHQGSIDLYSYANGNPIKYADPDGRYASAVYESNLTNELASIAADATPGIGNAKSIYELAFGKDLITGRQLSTAERCLAAAGIILPQVKLINKSARIGKAAINIIDASKTTNRIVNAGDAMADVTRFANSIEHIGKNKVLFQGMEVRAVRDLSHLDIETLNRMVHKGVAPQNIKGQDMVLHHLKQNPAGPLVEVPSSYHKISNNVQHFYGNAAGKGLTSEQRAAHNKWRQHYWKTRASEELSKR